MAFLNARPAKTAAELITGSGGIKSVPKVESQTTPLIKGSSTVGGTKITTTGKTVTYSTPITNVSKATNGTTGAAKLTENITGTTPALKTAAESTSSTLKSLAATAGKMTVAAGVGAIVASTFTGSANAELGTTTKDPTKDDSIVTTATDENGNPYYVYNTGSEAVDDALGWLQSQIDEIVSFLNSLFGESGNTDPGAGGGIYGTTTTEQAGTAATAAKSLLIPVLVVAGLAVAFILYKRSKKGKTNSTNTGGKQKAAAGGKGK